MSKIVKNAEGQYVAPEQSNMIDNLTAGLQAPMLKADEGLDAASARWAAVVYGTIGVVAGGFLARKRAEAGKPAIGGYFL